MKVDTKNEDPKYWESILEEEGLTMDQGSFGDPRQRKAILIYLTAQEIKTLDENTIGRAGLTEQE